MCASHYTKTKVGPRVALLYDSFSGPVHLSEPRTFALRPHECRHIGQPSPFHKENETQKRPVWGCDFPWLEYTVRVQALKSSQSPNSHSLLLRVPSCGDLA